MRQVDQRFGQPFRHRTEGTGKPREAGLDPINRIPRITGRRDTADIRGQVHQFHVLSKTHEVVRRIARQADARVTAGGGTFEDPHRLIEREGVRTRNERPDQIMKVLPMRLGHRMSSLLFGSRATEVWVKQLIAT